MLRVFSSANALGRYRSAALTHQETSLRTSWELPHLLAEALPLAIMQAGVELRPVGTVDKVTVPMVLSLLTGEA